MKLFPGLLIGMLTVASLLMVVRNRGYGQDTVDRLDLDTREARASLDRLESVIRETEDLLAGMPAIDEGCARDNQSLWLDEDNLGVSLGLAVDALSMMRSEWSAIEAGGDQRQTQVRAYWILGISSAARHLLYTVKYVLQLLSGGPTDSLLLVYNPPTREGDSDFISRGTANYHDLYMDILLQREGLLIGVGMLLDRNRSFCREEFEDPWDDSDW